MDVPVGYGLEELRGGISVERAIDILRSACNRPHTMFVTEAWLQPRLARLRSKLADPITIDQAEALLDAILQRSYLKDVLEWLSGEPIPWRDYQVHKRLLDKEAKRARAEEIRKRWANCDWDKLRRLQDSGFHVHIPFEVVSAHMEDKLHVAVDVLELYALNRLSGTALATVEEHLLGCPTCQDRLEETDAHVKAMQGALRKLEGQ